MSDYDRIMITTRHAELDELARRHQAYAEARREMARTRRSAPSRLWTGLRGLRLGARRSLKGRRSLA
jgi:hypothetical protein